MKHVTKNSNAFNLLLESINDPKKLKARLKNINPNCRDCEGLTAIFHADNTECVKVLLDAGAGLEVTLPGCLDTPLLYQLKMGNDNIAAMLVEAGANVNAKNGELVTALHLAQVPVLQMLLDRGADIEARNDDGETPLHVHAFGGHVAEVELLLESGADVFAVSYQDKSVSDMAAFWSNNKAMALIDAHMQKKSLIAALAMDRAAAEATTKRRM